MKNSVIALGEKNLVLLTTAEEKKSHFSQLDVWPCEKKGKKGLGLRKDRLLKGLQSGCLVVSQLGIETEYTKVFFSNKS